MQLSTPDLEHDLPAPRARRASSVKLPVELTPLVGRAEEIALIASQLEDHDVRLVTLTGPGGMGKTRLAVAAAAAAAPAYPDGVFFVPLADAFTEEQVIAIAAEALGVRGEGARPLRDTIHEQLATDRALLVLDNFEQVLDARTAVASVLARCPGIDLLVTSRTPLRIRGEHEFSCRPCRSPRRSSCSRIECSQRGRPGRRPRRTWPQSPRSAGASTDYPLRSSSPPRVSASSTRPRCSSGSANGSTSWAAASPTCPTASGR